MTLDALIPLSNQAGLYYQLQQDALKARLSLLGEYRWEADTSVGELAFVSKADSSRRVVAGVEVIASIAPGPRSLLWGWGMEQGKPDGYAARLREYGVEHGISELTEAEVSFPSYPIADLGGWVLDAAHQVGAVACMVTGRGPYFAADTGGGSRVVLMLTLDPPLPQPTVDDVVTDLPRLLNIVALSDPRSAVYGLARLAAWELEWADEQFTAATMSDETGKAVFRFDELGRITGVQKDLTV